MRNSGEGFSSDKMKETGMPTHDQVAGSSLNKSSTTVGVSGNAIFPSIGIPGYQSENWYWLM
ncbi:unnamed protein product [Prunus armeniaca]|uniref:Uncharacterized protein n=1 Tax=Prunus armeniaca TaxID=36596 RepID=A0A6J5WFP3_PRUAR|nr:unnamed protein product [Prunus armeniaca]